MSIANSPKNKLFLLCGVIYLVLAISLSLNGNYLVLGILSIIIAPLSAFIIGIYGMKLQGPDLYAREDRYQMIGVMLSMSLLMFTLAEISAALLSNLPASESFVFTVGLLQLTGLLPLSLGVFRYLDSTNKALSIANRNRLWSTIFLISIIMTSGLYLVSFEQLLIASAVDIITITPIILLGFSVILSLALLAWVFRHGKLCRPFLILLFALIFLIGRVVAWCCLGFSPIEPLSQAIAAVSYFIFGGTLQSTTLS